MRRGALKGIPEVPLFFNFLEIAKSRCSMIFEKSSCKIGIYFVVKKVLLMENYSFILSFLSFSIAQNIFWSLKVLDSMEK